MGGVKIAKMGVTTNAKIVIKNRMLILAEGLFVLFRKNGLSRYLSKGL
jgi:hypothetical protein